MSENALKFWQKYPSLAKKMLECFDLSLPQSETDRERFEKCGVKNSRYIGNLKFDAPSLPADAKELGVMIEATKGRNVWLAASTHEGEETRIAEIHKNLKEKFPNLLTIICPRHPPRGKGLKDQFEREYEVSLRSEKQKIKPETDLYIADTIGELGIFYRISNIVFMGGSLIPHGGQNPLEAARLECAIITGDYTHNFTRIYEELETNNASFRVTSASQLSEKLEELLNSPILAKKAAENALQLIESKQGVVDLYIDEIGKFLIG
jgi:3-deoxy-D-manno-octulosonic-acid transferase